MLWPAASAPVHRRLADEQHHRPHARLQRAWPDHAATRSVASAAGGPFSDGVGLLRMFDGEIGTEIAWLLPLALVAVAAIVVARRARPADGRGAHPGLLWGGWLLVTGLVFSLMQGIFHEYYTVALAPAIGALVGIGGRAGLAPSGRLEVRIAVAAALAGSAAWMVHLLGPEPSLGSMAGPAPAGGRDRRRSPPRGHRRRP